MFKLYFNIQAGKKKNGFKMTDSDEESSSSENNWPMNEEWMTDVLRGDDKSDGKVKINVIFNRWLFEFKSIFE